MSFHLDRTFPLNRLLSPALPLAFVLLIGRAASPPETANSPKPQRPAPVEVDLRPKFEQWDLARWRQGGRPTCSAFTVAGALEFAAARKLGNGTRFSVEFLNWASNETTGDKDDGGFFSDLWKGFQAHGICGEPAMPYRPQFQPDQAPTPDALVEAHARLNLGLQLHWIKEWDVTTGLTDAHLVAIKQTLQSGWPICGGFRWPKKDEWKDGVLQPCGPDDVRDGHSVLLIGYRQDGAQPGGGVFLFRNTSGDGRDGAMPYAYAQAYMNDAAWIGF
ncbi:MAG: C1 family peptidase [Verrucomicrobiota bacterium]